MKSNLKQPCKDCPFLKKSIPNYLGSRWTAIELHRFVMSENKFACHNTIKEDGQPNEELEHCVGSILYMNKNAKKCVDKSLLELQEKFRGSPLQEEILNLVEFIKHHKDAEKLY